MRAAEYTVAGASKPPVPAANNSLGAGLFGTL